MKRSAVDGYAVADVDNPTNSRTAYPQRLALRSVQRWRFVTAKFVI
jgi:hypothetical protein